MKKIIKRIISLTVLIVAFSFVSCNNEVTPDSTKHEHRYKEIVIIRPTCTERGLKEWFCSCGESYTEKMMPLGHYFSKGVCVRCHIFFIA